jgi:hypothetical protein
MECQIFISYKRANKDQVFPIVKHIEEQLGVRCWVDLDGIESSAQFASVICKAIDSAKVVLFMHSSVHLNIDFDDDWTVMELHYAENTGKRVVLVKLDGAPLKNIFLMKYGTKNNIDSRDQLQMQKLITDLRNWLNLPPMSVNVNSINRPTSTLTAHTNTTGINYPKPIPETWKPIETKDANGRILREWGSTTELAERGFAEAQYERGKECIFPNPNLQGNKPWSLLYLYPYIKNNCNTPKGEMAADWFLKAALQGYKPAIESLAYYYYCKGDTQNALHYGLLSSQDNSLLGACVAYKSFQTLNRHQEHVLMMERAVEIIFQKGGTRPVGFPDNFDCCTDLAKEYHKSDINKAITLLERLGRSGLPIHHYTLATYYEETGQQKKAREKYKYVAEHFGGQYKEMAIKKLGVSAKLSDWWNKITK